MRWYQRLFLRARTERQINSELQFHLERQIADYVAEGMAPEEACRRARLEFGGLDQVKEECRDVGAARLVEILIQDLRFGLRQVRRNPGFAAVAIITLALGIGANTAIFSVLNAVRLRALPVRTPARLVQLEQTFRGKAYNFFSYPTYIQLRNDDNAFSSLFAWAMQEMNLTLRGETEPAQGMFVTGNYFSGLGVPPFIGRTILPEDDRAGAPPVAVLSYGFWQKRFGGDPGVIGKAITVEHVPVTIVGVTPSRFFGAEVGRAFELAVPLSLQPRLNPDRPLLNRADAQWIRLLARLAPSISEQRARAESTVLWPQIVKDVDPRGMFGVHNFGLRIDPASTGLSQLRVEYSHPLLVLLSIAGLVLLIACANVANLLLARASTREREFAVRAALGAGRFRVARQMLTESILLAALGGAVGLVLAFWGAWALVGLLSTGGFNKVILNVSPDWRVLAFTACIGSLTAVLFGMVPALRAARMTVRSTDQTVSHGRGWANRALMTGQIALSLALLMAAGLFVRSLQKLLTIDPGFNPHGVLLAQINPARAGYKGTALASLYQHLLERIQAIPGVRTVSLSSYPPLTGGGGTFFSAAGVSIDGRRVAPGITGNVWLNQIGPRFFRTLGTPLLAGRDFSAHDSDRAPRVAIVSETLAREFFPDRSAIGHQIQVGKRPPAEIVGVVKTMKYEKLRETPHYILFEPYLQSLDNAGAVYVEIRSAGSLSDLGSVIRRQIAGVAPQVPSETFTLDSWVNQFLTTDRMITAIAGVFGILAMLLAAVGLYGMMAYSVTQRTHEMGVRVALGAQRSNILRMIVGRGLRITLGGVGIGIGLALVLTRFLASLLYGVKSTDTLTLCVTSFVLLAVALLACYIPARRAANVDPMVALRHE